MKTKKVENIINIPHIPFYFIRHGQTDYNLENKVMGQIDIPLNEVGLEQAKVLAEKISHLEISHIVSSPLTRAMQTAEIIATNINKPITVIDELKQNALGILEGLSKAELINGNSVNNLIEEHLKNVSNIEGAEHWADFVSRISVGLNFALEISPDKRHILIVAHKPTYWALLQILNAQAVDIETKNCGGYSFTPPIPGSNQWIVNALYN